MSLANYPDLPTRSLAAILCQVEGTPGEFSCVLFSRRQWKGKFVVLTHDEFTASGREFWMCTETEVFPWPLTRSDLLAGDFFLLLG